MNLGVLCSGSLGFKTLLALYGKHPINFIFTDFQSEDIIKFCEENNLAAFLGNPRGGKAKEFTEKYECDILISINYLFLIEGDVIGMARKLAFNIHGSLLPKYRGRTPHVWSIINGEKYTGITAHVIDEGCDTGDILEQIKVSIEETDTGNDILKKYEKNYLPLIEKVIDNIKRDNIVRKSQNSAIATYFGKREPTDGLINWDWQRERIYNWVRAQAYPYPGAFSFYIDKRITIDEVQYSNLGFHYNMENGTILNEDPLTIKTSIGALEINSIREKIKFKKGDVLS